MNVIETHALTYNYDQKRRIFDLKLQVKEGEWSALSGLTEAVKHNDTPH